MTKRDLVISQLNLAMNSTGNDQHWMWVEKQTVMDAVEILNEEPIRPIEKNKAGMYFVCGNCQYEFGIVDGWPKYCPDCGRKVAWYDA